MKLSRKAVIAAVFIVCAAMLLSFAFVAFFAEHDCHGGANDGCPVCRVIDMCVQSARLFAPLAACMCAACAVTAVTASASAFPAPLRISSDPVKMKIRLRN